VTYFYHTKRAVAKSNSVKILVKFKTNIYWANQNIYLHFLVFFKLTLITLDIYFIKQVMRTAMRTVLGWIRQVYVYNSVAK